MRIIITGGSSGIGKAIVSKLKPEHYIEDWSRSNGVDITIGSPKSETDALILCAGVWEGANLFNLYQATKDIALYYKDKVEHMVFLLSNAAYKDYGNHDYTTVKSGLYHFANWLRDNSKTKITVISPGTTRTPFWDNAKEDNRLKCLPIEPEEVANCVKLAIDSESIISELIILPRRK